MISLETKSLTIGYKQRKQFKKLQQDIDFALHSGEITTLMGQNGVGKTTFLKSITGLIQTFQGEVLIKGERLQALSKNSLARQISLVLTERPNAIGMTVLELVASGRYPYSNWLGILSEADKASIEKAIQETKIEYLVDAKLFELSDGQFQKVMIARALAQETDIIILDEPVAHLDLFNKIEVITLLRAIAQNGKAVLISTHDLNLCMQHSDKVTLLNFNTPVKSGAPEDLILDGSISEALYLQDLDFDPISGTIPIKPIHSISISVKGDDTMSYWTKMGLLKHGFKVADPGEVIIDCSSPNRWQLHHKGEDKSYRSFIETLHYIKALVHATNDA